MLPPEAKEDILRRMRRIEGQARGVQRMINEGRDCIDILTQLSALRSAAYGASVELAQHYALECFQATAEQGSPAEAVSKLMGVMLRAPH